MATVKYAKISKYGVPIHPVFLRFREDVWIINLDF
jgi:hypothetical protein